MITDYLLNVLIIAALSVGILGTVMFSADFEGFITANIDKKVAIDFAQSVLSADCLVEEKGGDIRKGVFVEEKLQRYDGGSGFCLNLDGKYSVEIIEKETGDSWKISNTNAIFGGEMLTFPAVIKRGEEVVSGELIVKVNV